MTTHPHSWQVPPLGPFMVDGHTAAGTDQPVMSWASQCLMSPSSVMAQLNEQLGATQGGPRGRHRTALSKNNAEKSMFLLILLKRSHRPHLASEQELKKIQQMGGSSSLPFPQRYTQTGLFFLENQCHRSGKTHLWRSHSPGTGTSISQPYKQVRLNVLSAWRCSSRTGLLSSPLFTMTKTRAPASAVLSGTPYQATQNEKEIHVGAPRSQWCSSFF